MRGVLNKFKKKGGNAGVVQNQCLRKKQPALWTGSNGRPLSLSIDCLFLASSKLTEKIVTLSLLGAYHNLY